MKKTKAALILLIIVFLTISVVSFIYMIYSTIGVKEYDMVVSVRKNVGIDVGTDKIRFGGVKPGGGSTRVLVITNNHDEKVIVNMYPRGDIKDYVSLGDNNFILEPDMNKEVHISIAIPDNLPYGNYTGKLKVVYKRA